MQIPLKIKPILTTPSGAEANGIEEAVIEDPKGVNGHVFDFVRANWQIIAWLAWTLRVAWHKTNGALVINHTSSDDETAFYMGNEPMGIAYMTPREIIQRCDTTKHGIGRLLDMVASYKPRCEIVVVEIPRHGYARSEAFSHRPEPGSVTAPLALN